MNTHRNTHTCTSLVCCTNSITLTMCCLTGRLCAVICKVLASKVMRSTSCAAGCALHTCSHLTVPEDRADSVMPAGLTQRHPQQPAPP